MNCKITVSKIFGEKKKNEKEQESVVSCRDRFKITYVALILSPISI